MPGKRILLVLADAGFSTAMAKFLTGRDFDPVVAKNAAGALEGFATTKPDLVVVAQLLSGMDGSALIGKLKGLRPTLPAVLVAAVSSIQGLNDLRRTCDADAILPSTFQPEALFATIKRLLLAPEDRDKKPAAPRPPAPAADHEIEQTLKSAPKVDAAPQPVVPAPEKIAATSSRVVPIEPSWLISRAYADGVTGSLRFVSGGIERTIFFSQGRPIVVTSNAPEERIGQILVRKGKITSRELEIALAQATKKKKKLAEIIVDMGVMTMKEQNEEVADQYTERALALFAWHDAAIEFASRPPPDELIPISLAPERLIVEGLRRHYDAARLEALFHNPTQALSVVPDGAARIPALGLAPLEGAALLSIDGSRSIAEIVSLAPSRTDALRAVWACVCMGILV